MKNKYELSVQRSQMGKAYDVTIGIAAVLESEGHLFGVSINDRVFMPSLDYEPFTEPMDQLNDLNISHLMPFLDELARKRIGIYMRTSCSVVWVVDKLGAYHDLCIKHNKSETEHRLR